MLKTFFLTIAIFAKIGVSIFGGGYMILPVLERELFNKRQWLSKEQLADYFAMVQCQNGPQAINIAVLIATNRYNPLMGVAAALGIALPSFMIILAIAALLTNFTHIPQVAQAFAGIKVAVAALIVSAAWSLIKQSVKSLAAIIIFILAFALLAFNIISPIIIVIAAAAAGIIIMLIKSKRGKA
jgi:chromate transporter